LLEFFTDLLHDFQIVYTDVQIFKLGSHNVLKIQGYWKRWPWCQSEAYWHRNAHCNSNDCTAIEFQHTTLMCSNIFVITTAIFPKIAPVKKLKIGHHLVKLWRTQWYTFSTRNANFFCHNWSDICYNTPP